MAFSMVRLYFNLVGAFPIEIKTKIRYHIICCYHNFTLWNYDNNKLIDILFLVLIFSGNPPSSLFSVDNKIGTCLLQK